MQEDMGHVLKQSTARQAQFTGRKTRSARRGKILIAIS